MTSTTNEKLTITIADSDPQERKNWLIKAITASIRWYAQLETKTKKDDENLIVLTEFLEELNN